MTTRLLAERGAYIEQIMSLQQDLAESSGKSHSLE